MYHTCDRRQSNKLWGFARKVLVWKGTCERGRLYYVCNRKTPGVGIWLAGELGCIMYS